MRPTEELVQEHEGVLLALHILEKICQKVKSGETLNSQHIDRFMEFLKVLVDKCHHIKEEGVLFPAMEAVGIPLQSGPITFMLSEHQTGGEYIKSMHETFDAYRTGEKTELDRFVQNAMNYIALLRQHIDKENQILFPMADEWIPENR